MRGQKGKLDRCIFACAQIWWNHVEKMEKLETNIGTSRADYE